MSLFHPDETPEERHDRITEILHRNSQPFECDFCTRKSWRNMTNIGSEDEKIYACKKCIHEKSLLSA